MGRLAKNKIKIFDFFENNEIGVAYSKDIIKGVTKENYSLSDRSKIYNTIRVMLKEGSLKRRTQKELIFIPKKDYIPIYPKPRRLEINKNHEIYEHYKKKTRR